jgi:4-hydroxythreonine-4-phosphate dehydrogenase
MAMAGSGVAVVADDLSGAAESASAFVGRTAALCLRLDGVGPPVPDGVVVVDVNTRSMTSAAAARTLRAALADLPADVLLVKKIDSLLRGHVGSEVAVLAERGPVIVAPALPVLGRTVTRGVLHVGGVPLHETRSWSGESGVAPRSVAELFDGAPTVAIRTGAGLAERLADATEAGRIAICDTETDDDVDAIVRAGLSIPGAQFVGSSALSTAVARTLPRCPHAAARQAPSETVLTVVGTAEPAAGKQVEALLGIGVQHVQLEARALLDGSADHAAVSRALERGSTVVTIGGGTLPGNSRLIAAALGRLVAAALGRLVAAAEAGRRPDLVLTGGETARAVVDAIGLTCLRPIHVVHHGAVVCVAEGGRRVVTRPGSFGDVDSLSAITAYLTSTEVEGALPIEDDS